MAQEEKKFWQGTNFWVSLALAIGGLWSGFSESDATNAIGYFFALVGSVFAIREKIKDSTINWREWISSPNTWQYLAAVFISIFPTLSPELFQRINDLVASLISGNWQGVIGAAFSILTMLYYLFRKPKT
jgi:hypothetical protein